MQQAPGRQSRCDSSTSQPIVMLSQAADVICDMYCQRHTRARGVFFLSRKKGFFLGGSTGMSRTDGGGGGTVMGAPEMAVPEICTGGGGVPCNSAHPVLGPGTITGAMP